MWRIICAFAFYIIVTQFNIVENSNLSIPLFRQKTPKEVMLNSDNMEEYGIFLDWLKVYPDYHKHKNKTIRTNDSVALYRFLDTEFYGLVVVGHPGKTFKMIFDTAWRTTWLMSKDCSWKNVGCWFHNKYNHRHSSTYKANGTKFSVQEAGYTLKGYYSYENFSVAHSRVQNQLFAEITSVPYTYLFSKADGIIGLALKVDSDNPFFYNILTQTNITKPLFSIYLNRDRASNRGGNIILGAIEPKHIHKTNDVFDNITYVAVNRTNGWWQFKLDRVTINIPKNTTSFCINGCQAIADTSGNNIIGPKDAIESIYSLIEAEEFFFGYYRVNCDTVNKLPRIDFIIGGTNFTLKGINYIQKVSWSSLTLCLTSFIANNDPSFPDLWVLGGAFLSEFYSIYDVGKLQIGFVKAA